MSTANDYVQYALTLDESLSAPLITFLEAISSNQEFAISKCHLLDAKEENLKGVEL